MKKDGGPGPWRGVSGRGWNIPWEAHRSFSRNGEEWMELGRTESLETAPKFVGTVWLMGSGWKGRLTTLGWGHQPGLHLLWVVHGHLLFILGERGGIQNSERFCYLPKAHMTSRWCNSDSTRFWGFSVELQLSCLAWRAHRASGRGRNTYPNNNIVWKELEQTDLPRPSPSLMSYGSLWASVKAKDVTQSCKPQRSLKTNKSSMWPSEQPGRTMPFQQFAQVK